MRIFRSCAAPAALLCVIFSCVARAEAPAWLQVRDQNPFVLGDGVPLLPEALLHGGDWRLDAYVAEGNSQLVSRDAHTEVIFGGETRESRIALSYALADGWTVRASLGAFWFGVGFLDRPIQHFHALIGAPRGYRGGGLGVHLPYVGVTRDGATLYLLDRPQQGAAPLLADITRSWTPSDRQTFGLTLSANAPLGETRHLTDTGADAVAASAFADLRVFDDWQAGARVGYLHDSGNELLPTLARRGAPFADVYARAPLFAGWYAQLQYDVHGALYRDVPNLLGYGGILSIGLSHTLGANADVQLAISEDVPIAHTQDVVLSMALAVHGER